jgi:predicted nucleic acid-binding Zn ribbon protein
MERLGDTLRRWLAESGDVAGAGTLFRGWAETVGPELAAHTRPVEVERGRLIVAADHPGWVQLLRAREAAIVERLGRSHASLGITRIATVLGDRSDRSV